jgi:MoxR-like ATPase
MENKEESKEPSESIQDSPIKSEVSEMQTPSVIQSIAEKIKNELAKVVIGQTETINLSFIALVAKGHILLEGVPGVAKTLLAKSMAQALGLDFSRVQFTPDLMPSDVTGTSVFNMKESSFEFKKGPAFTQILLIDEINRAPAKTQASLFEVMQEKQITNDGETFGMKLPFFVMATQNPVEQEGTYSLPEAQLDRFIFKIVVDLPNIEEEQLILKRYKNDFSGEASQEIKEVVSETELKQCMEEAERVTISDQLIQYISQLVVATRTHQDVFLGGSPRASLNILRTAKVNAAIKGRDFVTPDDIKYVLPHVLNHRLILQPEREMAGITYEDVLDDILKQIEVPR